MSFDGMFTYGMTHELNEKIMGGRITKIHQPYKHDVIFHIRAKGKNQKLLLSAHPSYSRVHITAQASFLTMDFCLIILCTPSESATVTIAGSPSGIAATANETPAKNILYRS